MASATADGAKIRIETEAGTLLVETWEAKQLAAALNLAVGDLLYPPSLGATRADYHDALQGHKAWMAQRRAELGIEED